MSQTPLLRFSKQERQLFNAAMKLAVVQGELEKSYDDGQRRGLSILYGGGAALIVRLDVCNVVGSERTCAIRIIGESVGTLFDAQVKVTQPPSSKRPVREERVTIVRPLVFEQDIIERGLRLSLRKRNLLREHPGY